MKKRTGIKQIRGTDTMIVEYDNGTEETILNTEKIRTEVDYETALKRVEFLLDAKINTPEGDELEMLSSMIEKYEKEKYRF